MRTFFRSSLIVAIFAVLGCSGGESNTPPLQDVEKPTNAAFDAEEPEQSDAESEPSGPTARQSGAVPQELAQIEEKLRQRSLPAILITPSKQPPISPWQSRIGGVPYWPTATPLPTIDDGKPLFLLAQINFSEVPSLPGYPTEGILQVFLAAEDELYGLEFRSEGRTQEQINKRPRGHKVIYHPNPEQNASKLLSEAPAPKLFPVLGSYSLAFKEVQDPVGVRDYRFEQLIGPRDQLPDGILDKLGENFSGGGSKIGGYAFFTQGDPRAETAAAGWMLLLQIDTEFVEGISIKWGDSGVGNFFIRSADLAKGDFSNVWYNWDCF